MNRFTVTWWDDALEELARLWMEGADRDAINAATFRIDAELSRNPDSQGQEVSEGLWRIDVSPLRAYYSIREDDRCVEVVGVRQVS